MKATLAWTLTDLVEALDAHRATWGERWRQQLEAMGIRFPMEGQKWEAWVANLSQWLLRPDDPLTSSAIAGWVHRLLDAGFSSVELHRAHLLLSDILSEMAWEGLVQEGLPPGHIWPLLHQLERRLDEQRLQLLEGFHRWIERELEQKRGESEELLKAIFHASGEAILVLDAQGKVRLWNAWAERLLGTTRLASASTIGALFEEEVPPMEEWVWHLAEEAPLRWEVNLSQGEGKTLPLEILATPLRLPQEDALGGWVVVCHDLTLRKQMEQQQREANQKLRLLNEVAQAIASRRDLQTLFHAISEELRPLIAYDRMSVALLEEDGETLTIFALAAGRNVPEEPKRVPLQETSLGRAILEGRPHLANTPQEIAQYPGDEEIVAEGICSHIALPLIAEGEVLGTFNLCSSRPHTYSDKDIPLLEQVAAHFSLALQNARLLERERKRSEQLRLVAEVAERLTEAATRSTEELLQEVSAAIQERFGFFDVGIFLYNPQQRELVLKAHTGAYRLPPGYRQSIEHGILGWVVRHGQSARVPEVSADPRYYTPSPQERRTRSEMAIPIWQGEQLIGVLDVQSERPYAFDALDQTSMELLARLLGRALETSQLHQETVRLKELSDRIIATMPAALALLREDLSLHRVNERFCSLFGLREEEVLGRPLEEVLSQGSSLAELCRRVLQGGETTVVEEMRLGGPWEPERAFDLRCARIEQDGEREILLILDDVTERVRRMYHLSLLFQLGQAMQQTLDLHRLLHAILTSVTAGPGLGFNRASLYLREGEEMVERMRVGPADAEEAGRLWAQLAEKRSLQDFLDEYDRSPPEHRRLSDPRRFSLREALCEPLRQVIEGQEPYLLRRAEHRDCELCGRICPAEESIIVPLVSRGELKGLIAADNFITRRPITQEYVQLLRTFANQAGLALANAEAYLQLEKAYRELQETQEELIRKEKLATVGDMTTRIAHEIRGPLVTIGAMARRIAEQPTNWEQTQRYAPVISREVQRLERILRNVLDFTRPHPPEFRPVNLNRLVEEVLELYELNFQSSSIALEKSLVPDLPLCTADPDQMKQILFNLVRNALDAIHEDPTPPRLLRLETWAQEGKVLMRLFNTGSTIPPQDLPHVFHPFFTRRRDGTGLGLAIVKRVILEHGGDVQVESRKGEGTTVTLWLPLHPNAGQEGEQP